MKGQGEAVTVKNIVNFDNTITTEMQALAQKVGVNLWSFKDLLEHGSKLDQTDNFPRQKADDHPLFCYTSGTTGDSKGVKLTHKSLLFSCYPVFERMNFNSDDIELCYLPFAHAFEQACLSVCLISGMKLGFYQGNPLKLVEDCAILRPTFFPSVPRLFNKIYSTIHGRMNEATGCKKWLVNSGMASKTAGL
jgi:long-chain acyl-CoA synthetase